jgi:NitT/TauT family transport system ATP-binding protein
VAAVTGGLEVDLREKRFVAPDGVARIVLRDVAFRTRPGEFVALVGPSGCGKTTLLNIAAGLDAAFVGTVRGGGGPPSSARLGYVFQEPRLLPWLTVFENIALVLPRNVEAAKIEALLAEVGLAAARDVLPPRLSTGMARRAAIARAFAVRPELLLMDEPFVSLDDAAADGLRRALLTLWRRRPTTVLFVTHDLREALFLADRVLLLSDAPGCVLDAVAVPAAREARDGATLDRLRDDLAARRHELLAAAAAAAAARG